MGCIDLSTKLVDKQRGGTPAVKVSFLKLGLTKIPETRGPRAPSFPRAYTRVSRQGMGQGTDEILQGPGGNREYELSPVSKTLFLIR